MLHYKINGRGTPILFQHGLGGDLTQSLDLLGKLPNFQIIAADCPGHGASILPKGYQPNFTTYTDSLIELLDHLSVQQVVAGGISMGSGLVLNLAMRYPARVRALILVRPAWLEKSQPTHLQVMRSLGNYVQLPDGPALFAQSDAFLAYQKDHPEAAERMLQQFDRAQLEHTKTVYDGMIGDAPFRKLEDLKKINIPSLILGSEADPLHPWELAEALADQLSNSSIKKVPSRYLDNLGHTRQVRKIVKAFLADL